MVEVTSPAALETRLHFTDFQLPPGARLFVASPTGDGEPTYFEGKGPFGTGEFWSPVMNGETIRLELMDASDASLEKSGALPFHVTSVGHVYEADGGGFGSSAPCELDFVCYPDYATTGQSVAEIQFSDPQYIYACSAVLINNLSGDFSPLLLTAHHCISSDALAKTVSVNWRFQSYSCNSTSIDSGYNSNYATLLATTYDTTDASLLQILGSIPSTSTWAAWTTQDPDVGSSVTGIHHPHADPKKISFGKGATGQDPNRNYVMWDQGIMEPGSSGSPLFNANNQVVGQLYGGLSTCSVAGPDAYGKLRLSEPQLTGPGGWNYLEKGISDDSYAPNQTRDTATLLSFPSTTSGLTLKINADDWFRVSLAPGQAVMMSRNYYSGNDMIGVELFHGGDSTPFASTVQNQLPNYQNTDGTTSDLYIHLLLQAGVRTDYTLTLSVPAPPTASTQPISSPTNYGTMTLSGYAGSTSSSGGYWNPTVWYEYTTNPAFATWSETPHVPLPGVPYWYTLNNLTPATTYYIRLVAWTPTGTALGNIEITTTSPFPAPYAPSPQPGALNAFPSALFFTAGGSSFDIYLGADPDPPLAFPNAQLNAPVYSAYNTLYPLDWHSFLPGTHYYWKVTAHYQGVSASSPVWDFYTPQLATFQPSPVVFTPVLVGMSSTISVAVHVTYPAPGNPPMSFVLSGVGFSADLSAGCAWTCTIPITFHPTAAGSYSGSITVTWSQVQGNTVIPLTGTGFDMQLLRPARPTRPGTIVAGQSRQIAFSLDTTNVPGEVGLSCEVIPALADCEVGSASVSGGGAHDLSVTLRTSRRRPLKLRNLVEYADEIELGTPPGAYTIRVTASFAGVTRALDFPIEVR